MWLRDDKSFVLNLCPSFYRVMDDLTVKLTDHALSRDLFPQDYDCLGSERPDESRPLKFMAMESIQDRRFSTASDVVSTASQLSHLSLTLLFSGPSASFCGNWWTAACNPMLTSTPMTCSLICRLTIDWSNRSIVPTPCQYFRYVHESFHGFLL